MPGKGAGDSYVGLRPKLNKNGSVGRSRQVEVVDRSVGRSGSVYVPYLLVLVRQQSFVTYNHSHRAGVLGGPLGARASYANR